MKKIFKFILLLIWMGIIFYLSSEDSNSSVSTSNDFILFIYAFVERFLKISAIDFINKYIFIIRKLAHFTEFMILGILAFINFYKIKKGLFISTIFSILYACSDEIHQLFVSGRHFAYTDILIDSVGALFGILLINLFIKNDNHE